MPSNRPTSLAPVFTDKTTGRLYHQDGTPVGSPQDPAGTMPADLQPVFQSGSGLVDASGNPVSAGSTTQAAIVLPGTYSTDAARRAAVEADSRPDGALYLVDDGA